MKTPPHSTASLLTLLALLLLALVAQALVPVSVIAQDVDMIVIPVQGNVYMLQTPAAGGNIGVLPGPDGILLVDDQVLRLTESVVQGVRKISDEEIRFVINTHHHRDHRGGNEVLADMGATIIAHDNVRLRMLGRFRGPRRGGLIPGPNPPPERARPILTFNDAVTFHMNGEEVRVFLAPPAHTDGDSFVYFVDSDVLHLGDVFRTNEYPVIDVYNGGSVSGMIEAMEIAIGLAGPNTKVIPGHGFGFTDRDGLIEVLTMIVDLRAKIREMIIDGMQFHEVQAANPTAEYDEKWGQVASWTASDLVPIIYNEAGGGQLPAPPN